jgi:hypothetical protein
VSKKEDIVVIEEENNVKNKDKKNTKDPKKS